MEITATEFIASHPNSKACPNDERLEFAFIGRSNVGKSSLINMLTGKKGLAKVSQTPGKTQLINYFLIQGGYSRSLNCRNFLENEAEWLSVHRVSCPVHEPH